MFKIEHRIEELVESIAIDEKCVWSLSNFLRYPILVGTHMTSQIHTSQ